MIHKLRRRSIVCMLALLMMVSTVLIPFESASASTYSKAGGVIVYSNVNDLKTTVSAAVLANILADQTHNYVEIVLEKDGVVATNPVWFDKNALNWNITVPEVLGDYVAKIYMATSDGEQAHLIAGVAAVSTFNLKVGQIDGGIINASTDISTKAQMINVELSGITSTYDISRVKFHFINANGEDIYQANARDDETEVGKYVAKVNANKLTPQYGYYTISAEVRDENGATVMLTPTAVVNLAVAYTEAVVENVNLTSGTFDICTDKIYAAGEIDTVTFKVWCKGEKTDAKGYVAKADKSGSYKVTVDAKNHKYNSGKYEFRIIVKLKDGKSGIAATGSCNMNLSNLAVYGKTNGKFIKKIYIYNPTVKKNVYATLWSKVGTGVDKQTYEAKYNNNRLEITCTMSKLKGPGTAYLQLYQKSGGKQKNIKKYEFTVEMGEIIKTGWHYTKCSNGKTYKLYYKEGKKVNNVSKVLKLSKNSNLHIEVNRKKNRVTVYTYDEKTQEWCIPVIAFKCSVGLPGTPTPKGTYKTDRKHRWKELMGPSWGQYATHIVGGIYFHSIAGSTTNSYGISAYSYNKLGKAASHGCIRLTVRDAKWIYDYAALKTQVTIYDSEFAGPLDAQKVPYMPYGQHYDPTDPAVKK